MRQILIRKQLLKAETVKPFYDSKRLESMNKVQSNTSNVVGWMKMGDFFIFNFNFRAK